MATYKHIWDDFCSWYLELAKPLYGEPCDRATYDATTRLFERMLSMLHPFMPFLTEEVSSLLEVRDAGTLLCNAPFPTRSGQPVDERLLLDFELTTRIVAEVRSIRQKGHIPNKQALDLQVIVDAEWQTLSCRPRVCRVPPVQCVIRPTDYRESHRRFWIRP